jgi:NTP pyrophosphatase (non-canonical NTP hydrolase)
LVRGKTSINIKDYLLVSLGEEAGEVQQAVGKAYRFGFLSKNPFGSDDKNNWDQITQEVHDLVAIYEMLGDELFKVTTLDRGEVESKKKVKVKKWMNRAADIGRLNE